VVRFRRAGILPRLLMKVIPLLVVLLVGCSSTAVASYGPTSLNYAVATETVTSGTYPFISSGTVSEAFTLGNCFSFNATGQASSGHVGTYSYVLTGPNSATISSSDNSYSPPFVSTVYVTFTGPTTATFTTIGSYGGYSGSAQGTTTFTILQPEPANTGIALVEVYEITEETGTTHRLVNISTRGFVGAGNQVLIGGFVVSGTVSETLLLRAVGPALATQVAGVLPNPTLTLYDGAGNVIAANTGWGNAPTVGPSLVKSTIQAATSAIMTSVGAFPLSAGSADSALVAILPPGSYTFIASEP